MKEVLGPRVAEARIEDTLRAATWYSVQAARPLRDANPRGTLLRALQDGSLRALREGKDLPREAWANAMGRSWPEDVRFRREDVLALWPVKPQRLLAEAGEGDDDAPSGVRMIEVPRPMSSQAPHILAQASGLANSPEVKRHTSVTCLVGKSRGEGFEIEEEICKAAGCRDANEYWHVATSEPMKALSFAHLLAVHLIDPTERLNEFDRRSLVRRRIDSSLRFALKTGESWFIKDPLPSDGGGTGDLKALMLHPRTAAKWLLSLPKRRDLVPPGPKAFLERSERPDEREVPPQPLTKSNRDLEVLLSSTLRLFYGLMHPLTKFEIAMREYGRERRLAERILAERTWQTLQLQRQRRPCRRRLRMVPSILPN